MDGNAKGEIFVRELSCYCSNCKENDFGSCDSIAWVAPPKKTLLQWTEPKKETTSPPDTETYFSCSQTTIGSDADAGTQLAALVQIGDVVAVEADPDESNDEFWLFKASSCLKVADRTVVDEYGFEVGAGMLYIEGNYFDRKGSLLTEPIVYKFIDKRAFVLSHGIKYHGKLFNEDQSSGFLYLSQDDYEDITQGIEFA